MISRFFFSPSIATWASFVARAIPVFFLPVLVGLQFDSFFLAYWMILVTLQGLQLLLETSLTVSFVRGFSYAMGGAQHLQIERASVASERRSPNHLLLSRTWNMGCLLFAAIGGVTGVLLYSFGAWSGAQLIDKLPSQFEALGALAVFAMGGAFRAFGGLHLSYLYGVERIALTRWWETGFWLLAFVTAAASILSGAGMLSIALAYQIPLAAQVLWNMWLCRRDQRGRAGFERALRPDFDILIQLWPGIWRTGLGTTLFIGATQGAGLYFATVGEAEEVAAFLFAMSLIRPLGQFAQVPFFTKLPTLARMQAAGEREAQRKIAQRSMMLSYALHAFMVLGMAATLPLILGLLDSQVEVPVLLWLLIGLAGYIERMGAMHLQLYATTNHVLFHWANGLAAIIYIGLAALILPGLGVYAFPLAQILALLVAYVPIGMWNSYKTFGLPIPAFELKTSIFPLSALVIVTLVSMWNP
jgi:hypothetical protein